MSNVVLRARAMATLGGATELATFRCHDDLMVAVIALLTCHPHHFAVMQDGHNTLVVSTMAIECIKRDTSLQLVADGEE